MSYRLSVEERPSYLYFQVTGENKAETVLAYFAEIARECESRDSFRVLVDEQLDGPRLPAMEIFSIVSEGRMRALGIFEAIAYVDREMVGDMADFAETVAVNRGIPVAVFNNLSDAERWIARQRGGSDEKYIFTDGDSGDRDPG